VLAVTLWAYVVMRLGIKVGKFVPKNYVQLVEIPTSANMTMGCDDPHCTEELERARPGGLLRLRDLTGCTGRMPR
jgi:hypothetical protein